MTAILKNIKNKILLFIKSEKFKAFCLIYFIGLFFFLTRAAFNRFTLPLSGDYTLQTYAFYSQGYKVAWNFLKTGEYPLFDFSNFLGANYLGTQSFYYVYSPLFYLLCLWPSKFLYQGIFFHMVFKFALGGYFMYVLLRKYFHVSFKFSWIGGFIYAFSGWSLFYLWFHFSDVMAFFPLFIIGVERCLKERKGGTLAVGIFLCGLANYFFLVNFCIFGGIYALYRWIAIYGINKKKGYDIKTRYGALLQGIAFSLTGVLLAGICLFPSLYVASSTNRAQTSSEYLLKLLQVVFVEPTKTNGQLILGNAKSTKEIFNFENIKYLFRTLFVWDSRTLGNKTIIPNANIGYMFSNWIFMNTNCWDNVMFDYSSLDNTIGGFFITTPLTMLLIPSIVRIFKTKRPWSIFGVIMALIIPFIPITFHASFAFTSLYGRWELWIVLCGIIFIIPTLDKFEKVNRRLVTFNLILNYLLAIAVYFISKKNDSLPQEMKIPLFGKNISALYIAVFAELLIMLIVWFIYRFKFIKPALVKRIMIAIVILEVGASTIVTIEVKTYAKWDTYYIKQPAYRDLEKVVDKIKAEDSEFYRIMNTEATRAITNLPAQLNYNGASSFNSTYDFELDEFKNRSRFAYGGTWSMGYHEKRYWLDQYISSKYFIVDKKDPNNDNYQYDVDRTIDFDGRTSMSEEKQDYRLNLGWNYELYFSSEYYDVYINKDFNGIGYTVDNYISSSDVSGSAVKYEELYTNTAIIRKDEIEEFSSKYEKELVNTTLKNNYTTNFTTFSQSNWDLYFTPREDMAYPTTGKDERIEHPLTKNNFTQDEISSFLPSGNFLHKRWEERGFYGDQFTLKLKSGKSKLAKDATTDNMCYVNVYFKLGPQVLISFYNGDKLVTQDAHMNTNSSLNTTSYEWKEHRGFYLDQPVDKIVIEFIGDTGFDKLFNSGGTLSSIEITQSYQADMKVLQDRISENKLQNVTYKNNKFTFTTNINQSKLAVTSIPYDAGWTLKANGKEIETFVVNGGFIGFMVPEGEVTYSLTYFTPGLDTGLLSTFAGLMLLIFLCYVYRNKRVNILLYETQMEKVYYDNQKIQEDKELYGIRKFLKKILSIFKRKKKAKTEGPQNEN